MATLELAKIEATSPTLAEVMRSCFLHAGLLRAKGSSYFVLGNPKAWLGSAYHEVLEKIHTVDLANETLDRAFNFLWDHAIARQHQRISVHPLDRRFGTPETWPGYYVARAGARLRAEIVIPLTVTDLIGTSSPNAEAPVLIREQEFAACNGKLIGRPDLVRANEVVDYKSSGIFEYDENIQVEVLKGAYIRQLHIYGYLVRESLGWWPARGTLFPLAGAGVEIVLDPAECKREALEAIALLDSYNAKLLNQADLSEFASPSPQVCKWCPYKLLCPAFWQAASPAWSHQLDGAAVEGLVEEPPCLIHGGAALGIKMNLVGGSESLRQIAIAPLNPAVHTSVTNLGIGDRVRFIGLRLRPDGTLLPTMRTVFSRVADLPSLQTATSEDGQVDVPRVSVSED